MKLVLSAVIVVLALPAFAQKQAKADMAPAVPAIEQCTQQFAAATSWRPDSHRDFDEEVEFFLNKSYFWQDCIKTTLDKGANVNINFTVYTKDAVAMPREVERAAKAADEFMEELEDYIEEAQEGMKQYTQPKRIIHLMLANKADETKYVSRLLEKSNKHYRAKAKGPKVHISIITEKAPMLEQIDTAIVTVK